MGEAVIVRVGDGDAVEVAVGVSVTGSVVSVAVDSGVFEAVAEGLAV
jgi:hypothetical protein